MQSPFYPSYFRYKVPRTFALEVNVRYKVDSYKAGTVAKSKCWAAKRRLEGKATKLLFCAVGYSFLSFQLCSKVSMERLFRLETTVSQIHAGRYLTDEFPTKSCFPKLLISCQRSTETRLVVCCYQLAFFQLSFLKISKKPFVRIGSHTKGIFSFTF